jgi:hypothetical protein
MRAKAELKELLGKPVADPRKNAAGPRRAKLCLDKGPLEQLLRRKTGQARKHKR